MNNPIEIYRSQDGSIQLNVKLENETVWLSANQMAILFDRDAKTIRKHINNVFADGELVKESNTHFLRVANSDKPVPFYNLDVIISVGYRVKSQQGVQFRCWAPPPYWYASYAKSLPKVSFVRSPFSLVLS